MRTIQELTSELISYPSVELFEDAGVMKTIVHVVENKIRRLKGCFIKKFTCEGKPGLIVTFKPRRKRPAVFLGGHLDVVPADRHQFQPKKKGNRLYGRGAVDMKGGCAVMIALIETFSKKKHKPDIGFIFVTDEETSGNSARSLVKQGYRPSLFIAVEPTDLNLVIETKGLLWMEGKIKGVAAHGSRPWLGKNPVLASHEGLKKLTTAFPPLKKEQWKTSLNIGEVKSGDSFNRTPPDLTFKLDIRYIPQDQPKTIIQKVKKCFPASTTWHIERCDLPHKKTADLNMIQKLKKIAKEHGVEADYQKAPYATDARFFAAAGISSVVFGAKGGGMHGADEWVDLKSLEKVFEILKSFLYQ